MIYEGEGHAYGCMGLNLSTLIADARLDSVGQCYITQLYSLIKQTGIDEVSKIDYQ